MNKSSRRRFLASSAGLIGAGLTGLPLLAETKKNDLSQRSTTGLIYRTLGRTGIRVPIVSMGVMNASNPNLVQEAWKSVIRHFDSAWIYQNGNNELMIGRVLKELQVHREDVILASKVFLHDKRGVQKESELKELFLERFHQSLERLQTNYIDILYLHDVSDAAQVNAPWLLDTFSELKKSKKIRWAGFSTHSYWPELVKDAADKGFYDVILLSLNYSMSHDTASLKP
jgi:aryl-alcohol dehydrogenase-like predicted oxidoreductase